MTYEPDFFERTYQTKFRGWWYKKTYQIFVVPIDNAKTTKKLEFHPEALVIKYHQKSSNSCCLSSLASAFHFIGDYRSVTAFVDRIEESLTLQTETFRNIIHFANSIMKNRRKIKCEHNISYNMKVCQKNDALGILKNISEYVTLVQLMDSLVNVNHAISIVGYWIFDSKYKKSLCLTQ